MNVENLKSELQDVLDNDIVLRKEFNELKRSLSVYRNQLIMSDEDCKRLQVTIDVLNTKLVVIERDNSKYKIELTSFKELKGSISEQLQTKQDEIDARLNDIQILKNDINLLVADYEMQLEKIKIEASVELEKVTSNFSFQIEELKTNIHYKQSGIKEENENYVNSLIRGWADKEQNLILLHEESIISLKESFSLEINNLKNEHSANLIKSENSSSTEISELKNSQALFISELEKTHLKKIQDVEAQFKNEIDCLKILVEEQAGILDFKLLEKTNLITEEYALKESSLIQLYELQITDLKANSIKTSEELTSGFQNEIIELKSLNEAFLQNTISTYDEKIITLINEYENKLSNTLIHSNSQNTKLSDEIAKATLTIEELNSELLRLQEVLKEKEVNNEAIKIEFETAFKSEIKNKDIEYQKLLVENTNIINEIDLAQDKVEAQESEISILKAELEDAKLQSAGKVEFFKETLANRNFEITNIEANNVALAKERDILNSQIIELQNQLKTSSQSTKQLDKLINEKEQMANQLLKMNEVIGSLSQQVESEEINVNNLNNQRKNIILANNSNEKDEKSHVKEQINDLVREIDKCISLLSA